MSIKTDVDSLNNRNKLTESFRNLLLDYNDAINNLDVCYEGDILIENAFAFLEQSLSLVKRCVEENK